MLCSSVTVFIYFVIIFCWILFVKDVVLSYIFMVSLYGYLPLFCYSYLMRWAFPNHLFEETSQEEELEEDMRSEVVVQVSVFKASVLRCSDGFFLQNIGTSPMPVSNLQV